MRNVIATLLQTASIGLFVTGLFFVSPWLLAAVVCGCAGWFLAPDRRL